MGDSFCSVVPWMNLIFVESPVSSSLISSFVGASKDSFFGVTSCVTISVDTAAVGAALDAFLSLFDDVVALVHILLEPANERVPADATSSHCQMQTGLLAMDWQWTGLHLAIGNRQSAISKWQLAIGNQQSAIGNRQLAIGNQQSAVSSWQKGIGKGKLVHALSKRR